MYIPTIYNIIIILRYGGYIKMFKSNGYEVVLKQNYLLVKKGEDVVWRSLCCIGLNDLGLKYCTITKDSVVLVYKNKLVKLTTKDIHVLSMKTTTDVTVSDDNESYIKVTNGNPTKHTFNSSMYIV